MNVKGLSYLSQSWFVPGFPLSHKAALIESNAKENDQECYQDCYMLSIGGREEDPDNNGQREDCVRGCCYPLHYSGHGFASSLSTSA